MTTARAHLGLLGFALAIGLTVAVGSASGQEGRVRVDHSLMWPLLRPLNTASEVTEACLRCHSQAGQEVMKTVHWTWEYTTRDGQKLGKKHVVNNYCIAVSSNEPRCTSCHVGFGYTDNEAHAAMDETKVDCLICHDRSSW